jgi:hypothetical protein
MLQIDSHLASLPKASFVDLYIHEIPTFSKGFIIFKSTTKNNNPWQLLCIVILENACQLAKASNEAIQVSFLRGIIADKSFTLG